MNPEKALAVLTPAAIRTTAITLQALDALQGHAYEQKFEKQVRKAQPHSESDALTHSSSSLISFSYYAPMGNANGVKMFVSAFINGLQILELREEMDTAVSACAQFEQQPPND